MYSKYDLLSSDKNIKPLYVFAVSAKLLSYVKPANRENELMLSLLSWSLYSSLTIWDTVGRKMLYK